jgi:hypothetical protein
MAVEYTGAQGAMLVRTINQLYQHADNWGYYLGISEDSDPFGVTPHADGKRKFTLGIILIKKVGGVEPEVHNLIKESLLHMCWDLQTFISNRFPQAGCPMFI